ncbi:MAG: nascent polypeptide-associated complex protein [Halolamina sp.]
MFGGGGLNPRKMKQMMEQMGIDVEEIDAEEVVIRTAEEDLVFETAEVTKMDAQGQETYQIVGEPDVRKTGAVEDDGTEADDGDGGDGGIPDDDVEIVAMRADAPESAAREALEAADGDLAEAIAQLE